MELTTQFIARVLKKRPSVLVMANDESMAALDVDDDPATAPQTASGPSQQFVPSSQQPALRSGAYRVASVCGRR